MPIELRRSKYHAQVRAGPGNHLTLSTSSSVLSEWEGCVLENVNSVTISNWFGGRLKIFAPLSSVL